VVWRALRRDPAERYPSMAAFRHDLTHLDSVAIPRYPTESLARGPRIAREHLVNAAIIATVFLVLAVIGVIAQLAHTNQVTP
jgi:hypothetical protein